MRTYHSSLSLSLPLNFLTMEKNRIAIIGCGNLGKAIAKGLLDNPNYTAEDITVTKRNTATLSDLSEAGIHVTSNNEEALSRADLILVALKPHNILHILDGLTEQLDPKRHVIVSLATGVSVSELQEVVGSDIPVFRAMPNTGADVNESVTCITGPNDQQEVLDRISQVFNSIGTTHVISEDLMDAATVLGACGIAFVLRFMRAMVQGGIQIGFDAKTATAIVNQTVKGASQLVIERGLHPEAEIDKVTTPKGCTIAGLNEMEHNGFSSALIKGIVSSYERIEK